jgi:hypothetical protein
MTWLFVIGSAWHGVSFVRNLSGHMKTMLLKVLIFSFVLSCVFASAPRVLIIMPSLNYLTLVGGIQVEVGYYLDEFYWTAKALADANYDVLITTPQGQMRFQ